jgi:cbb3-type cytochrome oxidase maturation protein
MVSLTTNEMADWLMEPLLWILIPASLLLGGGFLLAFVRGALNGQWDDVESPAERILVEDHLSDHLYVEKGNQK